MRRSSERFLDEEKDETTRASASPRAPFMAILYWLRHCHNRLDRLLLPAQQRHPYAVERYTHHWSCYRFVWQPDYHYHLCDVYVMLLHLICCRRIR